MRIAACQMDVEIAEVDRNFSNVCSGIHRAGDESVDLVVFPECALTGYCFESREEAMPAARSIDDAIWTELADACRQAGGVFSVLGFLETDGERLWNAAALVGPEGVLGSYRKVHLPHLGVDRFVDRGDRPYAVHQAGDMRVGLGICYDSSFPEPMRVLALQGADIIALPTNWPVAAERTAHIVPPARSMENHLYFVAANRVGRERDFAFCGLSSICGPDGVLLARAPEGEEAWISAEINTALARNKRIERTKDSHVIDRFEDRQPEFYGRVTEPK